MTPFWGMCEPFSAVSHLLGAALGAWAGGALWRRAETRGARVAVAAFAATAVFQLLVSGVYHVSSFGTDARVFLQRLDHAAIWVTVAGCFLPLQHYLLPGRFGRGLRAFVLVAATSGLVAQTVFFEAIPAWVGVLLYVAIGSVGTPIAIWLVATRGLRFTAWFFLCGVSVSSGALLELAEVPTVIPGVIEYHEVVHVLVLAGLAFHAVFIAKVAGAALPASAPTVTADPALAGT